MPIVKRTKKIVADPTVRYEMRDGKRVKITTRKTKKITLRPGDPGFDTLFSR